MRKSMILMILLLLSIFGFVINQNTVNVKAVQPKDTWVVVRGPGNDHQWTGKIGKSEIIQYGTHSMAKSIRYRTKGYYMTLKTYNIDKYDFLDVFSEKERAWLYCTYDDEPNISAGTVETTYTIQYKDFMQCVTDLGVTGDTFAKSENRCVSVYLNNVFDVYSDFAQAVVHNRLVGYKEMITRQAWSSETVKVLRDYYNFEYKVYASVFKIKVIAVDTKGNILGTIADKGNAIYTQRFPAEGNYFPKETFVAKDGTSYTTTGNWYYKYTDRITESTIRNPKDDNKYKSTSAKIPAISIEHLPDALAETTVNIYVQYKEEKALCNIDYYAVDESGKELKLLLQEKEKYRISEDVDTKITETTLQIGEKYYKKTVNFGIAYEKKDGMLAYSDSKSDTWDGNIKFKIPTQTQDNSTIKVSIVYEETSPDGIPLVIHYKEQDTGKILKTENTYVTGSSTYKMTVPENLQGELSGYVYTGKGDWSYVKNTDTAPTEKKNITGSEVSISIPSAKKIKSGTEITIHLYYHQDAPDTEKIKLRVIAVNNGGYLIKELSSEVVEANQQITKNADEKITIDSKIYEYMNKWEYVYHTSSGEKIKSGTQSLISFTVPEATKTGTVITLKLFYHLKDEVTAPEAQMPIELEFDNPLNNINTRAYINADKLGNEYFNSSIGIPTTESQYTLVKTTEYLLGYKFINRTGVVSYQVPVTKYYTVQYYNITKTEIVEDVVPITQIVTIKLPYSYWEIENFNYYVPVSSTITNYSLPNGRVTLTSKGLQNRLPMLITQHSSNLSDHVITPQEVKNGIKVYATEPIFSEGTKKPTVEKEDLTQYVLDAITEVEVKNDLVIFDQKTIMSSAIGKTYTQRPQTISHCVNVTTKDYYEAGLVIDAEKKNGTYSSVCTVMYEKNSQSVSSKAYNLTYMINVNDVKIHTPVICIPEIIVDNQKWVQLLHPDQDAVQVVLDPDNTLGDFTLSISNTAKHSNRIGYTERDFSQSFIDPNHISYLAKDKDTGLLRNEVKFTFDVYIDIKNDKDTSNDIFLQADTWYVLGKTNQRFYVPMWVKDGTYNVSFRSVAVNALEEKIEQTEKTRNESPFNYVATAKVKFQISGRIYGLKIYDITDYPTWQSVFRVGESYQFKRNDTTIVNGAYKTKYSEDYYYDYTVGTKNQYGTSTGRKEKYTFPLVNGSHPRWKNMGVLKTGYGVRFTLDTTGDMYSNLCSVRITPRFYYIDKNGKNRQRVDIYYNESFQNEHYLCVKVGSDLDKMNYTKEKAGARTIGIPPEELIRTADILNMKLSKLKSSKAIMFYYCSIPMQWPHRTFIGTDYAKEVTRLTSFQSIPKKKGITELSLAKYTQRWYGEYFLPEDMHVAPYGYDVYGYMKKYGIDYQEDFWLKDGYIIVNFDIVTYDEAGNEQLSYVNADNYLKNGNCSMWVTEGAMTEKKDSEHKSFHFKAGDFIIYYSSKRMSDNYTSGFID